jgi:hypothetical protein
MVLALLVSMLALSIGGMLFTSIALSERNARQGRDFTTTLETADAGIQHALAQLNGGSGTPAPPATPLEVGDATVTYTATPAVSSSGGAAWEIQSTATSLLSGEQRRVVAVIEEESRFPFALFTDESITFRGETDIDSYTSGVICTPLPSCAWAAPYSGGGVVANNDTIDFKGNSTEADGVALYNWAADPDPNRCIHAGGGTDSPCNNKAYVNDRLDLTLPSETAFLTTMETACDGRWDDYVASEGVSLPVILQPAQNPPYHCFEDVTFDIDTILAPLTTDSLDVRPVIIVVKQGGTVNVGRHVEVNCLDPCTPGVSVPAAPHLQIYSLTSGNMLDLQPHSDLAAAVYAPLAGCDAGDSNAQADVYGALVCDRSGSNGGWNLHYDQALAGLGNGRYLVRQWREEPV